MTTQVDWWQIKNIPPGGGATYEGVNPDVGPFDTWPLAFDQETGFDITSGLAQLRLASLLQQGVIGTAGGQQLQGPLFFVGNPAAGAAPPLTGHSWGAILQDGGLGFYTSSEGALSSLNAGITYGPFGLLNFTNKHSMLWGAGTVSNPAAMQFKNLYANTEIDLDSSGNVTHTFNNIFRAVSLPPPATLSWGPFSPPATYLLDLESFDTPGPSYSLQGGTLVGQWGTSGGGDTVSGGIVTALGAGGGGVTIGNPVSGGTTGALLYVDGSTNLADSGAISTDGAGNLTVPGTVFADLVYGGAAALTLDSSVHAVNIPNVCNFGSNWVLNDGLGSGIVKAKFAPGIPILLVSSDTPIAWNSSTNLGGSYSGDTQLVRTNPGDVAIVDGSFVPGATIGAAGAQLCQVGGSSLGFFSIGPVTQQGATGLPGGWNPGVSGNFVQTDDLFNGGLGTTFYTIGDIVLALKQYGLLLQ